MDLDPDRLAAIGRACSFNRLGRAVRTVGQVYDARFSQLGVRPTQGMLLIAIGAIGEPSISDLAEAVGLDPSTLNRNLKPLSRDGYVSLREGDDRRRRHVRLTQSGQNLVVELAYQWDIVQSDLARAFGTDWSRELQQALGPVLDPKQRN